MRPQSPASSRLRPIRAANETTNRTAACVKVGACVGAKTGAAASVDGMMNTFDECGEFWKMGGRGDHILSLGPRYVSDSGADVYSRQATRRVLMRLIRRPSKAALPLAQDDLHSRCASFPWHTSAPVEVSDSALAGALLSHAP